MMILISLEDHIKKGKPRMSLLMQSLASIEVLIISIVYESYTP